MLTALRPNRRERKAPHHGYAVVRGVTPTLVLATCIDAKGGGASLNVAASVRGVLA